MACIIESMLLLKYREEVIVVDTSRLEEEDLPVIREIPVGKSEYLSLYAVNLAWKARRKVGPRGVEVHFSYLEQDNNNDSRTLSTLSVRNNP